MINLSEIKKVIQKHNITIFDAEMPIDILPKGFKFSTLDQLMNFCDKQNINICFIDVQYTNVDDYKITKDLVDERINVKSIVLKNRIIEKIFEYNQGILGIDDSNPTKIVIAVLYQSNYFYFYQQEDLLFEDDIILEPEEKLEEILEFFDLELEEEREKLNLILEQQINKLKEFVLNDPEFKYCSNKQLRKDYTKKLFKNKLGQEFKELKQHWSNPDIPAFIYQGAINEIELIWKELKGGKKK